MMHTDENNDIRAVPRCVQTNVYLLCVNTHIVRRGGV